MLTFALALPIIFWLGGDPRHEMVATGGRVISTRFLPIVCGLVAVTLVPTLIHSYADSAVRDGRTTASIPMTLAGYTGAPSGRNATWGQRRFESDDWTERRLSLRA